MFHVGQKVVCVDASSAPGRRWENDAPREGEIYTVTGIFTNHLGRLNLLLAEIQRGDRAVRRFGIAGYSTRRFRPVVERKTDISALKALLNTVPEKVTA